MKGLTRNTTSKIRISLTYSILIITALIVVFPLIWGIISSLKPEESIRSFPPSWIPNPITLQHYEFVLRHTQMPRFFLNSMIIATISTILSILIGSMAAYALHFVFPGRKVILGTIIGIMLIGGGGLVGLVPLYLIFQKILNTYTVMILIYCGWNISGTIFFMSGYFKQIPQALEDAAMIDGCNVIQTFFKIYLPLVKPGLVALATVNFIGAWNEFLAALTFIHKPEMRTVPVGIYSFLNQYIGNQYGPLLASGLLSTIPVLFIFIFLQRYLITGLLQGAIKG